MAVESDDSTRERVQTTRQWGISPVGVTASHLHGRLHGVIVREFGWRKHAAKLLAVLTGASPRTAEKWLAGTHMPQGVALLRLEANCEAVEREMARLRALARGDGP